MKQVIIYGASPFAEEVEWTLKEMSLFNVAPMSFYGYIDDSIKGEKILGGKDWLRNKDLSPYHFIVAIGNPEIKKRVVEYLDLFKVKYTNVIHPRAIYSNDIKLGVGIYIGAGNILTTGVEIKDHVIINLSCTVGHKTVIEKYSCINPGCNISGGVHIEEGVYMGTNAVILQNKKVGAYSVIGASAMVNKDVESKSRMLGVPAKNL